MRLYDGKYYRDMTENEITIIQEAQAAFAAAERTRPLSTEEVTAMLSR